MTFIYRYPAHEIVSSPIDPIEDFTTWIEGLQSKGYTSDLLKTRHGFTNARELARSSAAVSALAANSLAMLDQAYSGPANVSFLPLYYAILNLSKIYIVIAGRRTELNANQRHGVSYDVDKKRSQKLINENLTIWPRGVFPLFHEVLTGVKTKKIGKLPLSSVYPYLSTVGHELTEFQGVHPRLHLVFVQVAELPNNKFRMTVDAARPTWQLASDLRQYKALLGFSVETPRQRAVTNAVGAVNEVEAIARLGQHVRRPLLYALFPPDEHHPNPPVFIPDCSMKNLLMAEEVPIWLALYHLSSVVRYSPEYLARLRDSTSWPLLLSLRKHAVLRFLTLFWSNVHQRNYYLKGM